MAERPDLAVVVVNYNAGDYLRRCLESVRGSTGGAEVEVVVVDNASRDGSADAARGLPGVRLIENPDNRGLSAAWNQGIGATTAPYVLLLNPDAEIGAGDLARLVKVGEEHPRAGVIGPLVRNPDGTVYESGRRFPSIPLAAAHAFLGLIWPGNPFSRAYRLADWDRTTEREVDWVSGSCWVLRRAALDEVGVLDEALFLYGEELDLCTRMRAERWSVLFTPAVTVVHQGGVSTGRSRRRHLQHSRSIYRYFVKHRSAGWRRVLLPPARLALRLRAELAALRDRGRR